MQPVNKMPLLNSPGQERSGIIIPNKRQNYVYIYLYIYTYVKPPSQYHRFLMAEKAMSKNVRYQFLAVPCGKPGINCEQGDTALKAV